MIIEASATIRGRGMPVPMSIFKITVRMEELKVMLNVDGLETIYEFPTSEKAIEAYDYFKASVLEDVDAASCLLIEPPVDPGIAKAEGRS